MTDPIPLMPAETQATPAVPSDEGPTDCIHCGQRIRRFGQTRRWCHDETGDVQCATAPARDVNPQGPGYAREARAHTRSDQPHKQPEDEAVVEQLLGTLAAYHGYFGPRDASIYAASLLEMARGRRGITPAKLVEYLNLCPTGGWHFTEECDVRTGCASNAEESAQLPSADD